MLCACGGTCVFVFVCTLDRLYAAVSPIRHCKEPVRANGAYTHTVLA